ncbi:RidA family protein [Microbacterium sp. AGC85]
MSVRRVSSAPGLADPVGAFSHAIIANGFVYTSGQLPTNADGRTPHGFEAQIDQALTNLRTILIASGSDLDHVVKVNGYLTNADHLEVYNAVYRRHFGDSLPARTTVCVALWGTSLEIDCVAVVRQDGDDDGDR